MRQRVIDECLVPYLHDRRDAWMLNTDGSFSRIGSNGVSAQQALTRRFQPPGHAPSATTRS
jgi:polyphosphate kinase